jgi:hypothetical protein
LDFIIKKNGKRKNLCYFLCDITDPPITERIPNNSPAIGMPVCCIGIILVAVLNIVFVVGVVWLVGFIGLVDVIVIGVTP